jgi:hypothetical protein
VEWGGDTVEARARRHATEVLGGYHSAEVGDQLGEGVGVQSMPVECLWCGWGVKGVYVGVGGWVDECTNRMRVLKGRGMSAPIECVY